MENTHRKPLATAIVMRIALRAEKVFEGFTININYIRLYKIFKKMQSERYTLFYAKAIINAQIYIMIFFNNSYTHYVLQAQRMHQTCQSVHEDVQRKRR